MRIDKILSLCLTLRWREIHCHFLLGGKALEMETTWMWFFFSSLVTKSSLTLCDTPIKYPNVTWKSVVQNWMLSYSRLKITAVYVFTFIHFHCYNIYSVFQAKNIEVTWFLLKFEPYSSHHQDSFPWSCHFTLSPWRFSGDDYMIQFWGIPLFFPV